MPRNVIRLFETLELDLAGRESVCQSRTSKKAETVGDLQDQIRAGVNDSGDAPVDSRSVRILFIFAHAENPCRVSMT